MSYQVDSSDKNSACTDLDASSYESEEVSISNENTHKRGGQITDSEALGQEGNACDNGQPVNKVGSDIKPPAVYEVKYDPSVDDVTD